MRFIFVRTHVKGQAMLITILVLSFLVLGFVLIGISTMMQESQSSTVIENKSAASAAATACLDQAINRLGRSATYVGNETLSVGTQTCTIRPIIVGSGTWTIEASAQMGDQVARYRSILTSRAPVVINTWTEIAAF